MATTKLDSQPAAKQPPRKPGVPPLKATQVANAPEVEKRPTKPAPPDAKPPKPPTQKELAEDQAEAVYRPAKEHAARTYARANQRDEETETREITMPKAHWAVIDRFAEMAKIDVSAWLARHFRHMAKG